MTSDRRRLERYDASTSTYTIMQITDEDRASQVTLEDGETYFMARLRHDRAHRHVDAAGAVRYSFEHIPDDEGGEVHVYSKFGEVDTDTFRGGEFSELLKWDRHMLVFDDRTGIIGELRGANHMIIPRQMLMTGSKADKTFSHIAVRRSGNGFRSATVRQILAIWQKRVAIGSGFLGRSRLRWLDQSFARDF
ncbi:hypothetical protein VQ042_22955 [Aurantimonas sp. A2-1-M11]|uniref:hypothetical protein n=1 Tax=Aurantimonas sp. A2-1-M11 TaxID=3113712 RepID=UPI002F932808